MTVGVFLDRDGVLNATLQQDGRPVSPTTLDDFRILPGVASALESLKQRGARLIVVTNRPDVQRGVVSRETVDAMHAKLQRELPIDEIKTCFHTDEDQCACRKPKPGMILEAARQWGIDVGRSYLVGDRARDMFAGRNAGCRTVLVDWGYDLEARDHADAVVDSLPSAARVILDRLGASDRAC